MQSSSRRALLGTLATLPVTGCLGLFDDTSTPTATPTDPATPTPTATPSPTPSEPAIRQPGEAYVADDVGMTVSDLAVRHGMVTFTGAHPDPTWVDGAQFLLAAVTVAGERNPADIDVTATADTLAGRPDRSLGFAPDAADSVQPVGFAVPTDAAISEAAVVWHGPREVRWPVPADLVAKLGRAPEFSLEDIRAPGTAREGADIEVELDVANTGDRDGHFLAELGNDAISDQPEIEVAVPAGETVTATRTVEARFFDGEMRVVLRWEGGLERRSVEPA